MTDIPKKILCVEDEPFIGDLYKRALTKAGHNIDVITNGTLGLERALSNEYDIILLDIMVPELSGIDVLQELRTKCPDLKAKVIICTNLEQDGQSRAEIESKADGYIIKAEITPSELVTIVSQF